MPSKALAPARNLGFGIQHLTLGSESNPRPPTPPEDELLRLLQLQTFKRSPRKNVIGQSLFLGLLKRGITEFDASASELLRMIKGLMCKYMPEVLYSTVIANKNTTSKLHRDGTYNIGDSAIIAVGSFQGGEFELVQGSNQCVVDINGRFCRFSGRQQHRNLPYTGERFSVVCFLHTKIRSLTPIDIDSLRILFNPPLLLPQDGEPGDEDELGDEFDSEPDSDAGYFPAASGFNDDATTDAGTDAGGDTVARAPRAQSSQRAQALLKVHKTIVLNFLQMLYLKLTKTDLSQMSMELSLKLPDHYQKSLACIKMQALLFETFRHKIDFAIKLRIHTPVPNMDMEVYCVITLDGLGVQKFAHLLHDMRNHPVLRKIGTDHMCYYNGEWMLPEMEIRHTMSPMDTVHIMDPAKPIPPGLTYNDEPEGDGWLPFEQTPAYMVDREEADEPAANPLVQEFNSLTREIEDYEKQIQEKLQTREDPDGVMVLSHLQDQLTQRRDEIMAQLPVASDGRQQDRCPNAHP